MIGTSDHVALLVADPGRRSLIATWPDNSPQTGGAQLHFDCEPPLVLDADLVDLADAVSSLVGFGRTDDMTPSLRALGALVDLGLDLIARGRVWPGSSPRGLDQWRVGPLDAADRELVRALADALPAELWRARTPDPSSEMSRVASPTAERFVISAVEALADCWLREHPRPQGASSTGWLGSEAVDVRPLTPWITALADASRDDQPRVALELSGLHGPDAELMPRLSLLVHTVTPAAGQLSGPAFWRSQPDPADERSVIRQLQEAARVWPPLRTLLQADQPHALDLNEAMCAELLAEGQAALRAVGVEVLIPATALARPKVTAQIAPLAGLSSGNLDLETLCTLRWSADLDGDPLTASELDQLARSHRGAVRLRGRWVVLDAQVANRIRAEATITLGDAIALELGLANDAVGGFSVEVAAELRHITAGLRAAARAEREAAEPAGLKATLRPYQRRGLAWLETLYALNLGGCLADDMGLGKTVQLLALQAHVQALFMADTATEAPAPTLVVAPLSLLTNWEREVRKFLPGTSVIRIHGATTPASAAPDGVALTTYGTLRSRASDFATQRWGVVVADEAQHIKNARSATSQALRQLRARCRIALTGTPIENRLEELWSILDWTTPGLLGPAAQFRQRWCDPIEAGGESATQAARALGERIAPFLVRRLKSDPTIVPDLPPKTEIDVTVQLTEEQAGLYRATTTRELDDLRTLDNSQAMTRRGRVLRLLTELKQICDHPALYLGERGPLAQRSGKLAALEELLAAITDAGERALVFTQYVGMAELLAMRLGDLGLRTQTLTGSLSPTARAEVVDTFQGGKLDALVLSLKAGGTGLNLTAASHVVHFDRWWNPAVEDQASDRAWRIGQTQRVTVHRLVCAGTLEESIAQLLETKRDLASSVIGAPAQDESFVTELTNDQLNDLLTYRGTDG